MKVKHAIVLFFIASTAIFMSIPASFVYAVDCTKPGKTGNSTVSASCTYVDTIEGATQGNIIVAANQTLTVRAGQRVVVNNGYKIDVSASGSKVVLIDTGIMMTNAKICHTDNDGDSYPESLSATEYTLTTCPSGTAERSALAAWTIDCNDADAGKYADAVCYQDQDGDTYTLSTPSSVCGVGTCASGWEIDQSAIVDCNDTSALVWTGATQGTCYKDQDNDNHGKIGSASWNCFNNQNCTLATAGSVGSGSVTSTNFATVEDDCCDSNANAFPGQTAWQTTAMTYNASTCPVTLVWDFNCDDVETKQYTETLVSVTCSDTKVPGECHNDNSGNTGWQSGIRACGDTGTWKSGGCCYNDGECGSAGQYPNCSAYQPTWSYTQGCR